MAKIMLTVHMLISIQSQQKGLCNFGFDFCFPYVYPYYSEF